MYFSSSERMLGATPWPTPALLGSVEGSFVGDGIGQINLCYEQQAWHDTSKLRNHDHRDDTYPSLISRSRAEFFSSSLPPFSSLPHPFLLFFDFCCCCTLHCSRLLVADLYVSCRIGYQKERQCTALWYY